MIILPVWSKVDSDSDSCIFERGAVMKGSVSL